MIGHYFALSSDYILYFLSLFSVFSWFQRHLAAEMTYNVFRFIFMERNASLRSFMVQLYFGLSSFEFIACKGFLFIKLLHTQKNQQY